MNCLVILASESELQVYQVVKVDVALELLHASHSALGAEVQGAMYTAWQSTRRP